MGLAQHIYQDNELKAQKKMALLTNHVFLDKISVNSTWQRQFIHKDHLSSQFKVNSSTLDLLKSKGLVQLHNLQPYSLKGMGQVAINRDKSMLNDLVSSYLKKNQAASLSNSKFHIDVKKENIYDREL